MSADLRALMLNQLSADVPPRPVSITQAEIEQRQLVERYLALLPPESAPTGRELLNQLFHRGWVLGLNYAIDSIDQDKIASVRNSFANEAAKYARSTMRNDAATKALRLERSKALECAKKHRVARTRYRQLAESVRAARRRELAEQNP